VIPEAWRAALADRFTAGVAIAGAVFVIVGVVFLLATRIVMRSDVEVGSHRNLPNFAKDARPRPLQLPLPLAAPAAPPASAKTARSVPAPRPAQPAPAARQAGPRWVFEGTVYNLISLRPVFAATLTFKDASGKVRGETTTGADGTYRVSLDPLADDCYDLAVQHSDYQEKYLDETNPPFKERIREERLQLVNTAPRPRPWIGKTARAVRRDVMMIPTDLGQSEPGGADSTDLAVPSQ
jgi:hypothetical protein